MRHVRRPVRQSLQTTAIANGERLPVARLDDLDDLDALGVAIQLRAARVAADLPSDEFVASLRHRLIDERRPSAPAPTLSRRALFAGAGAAAAAAVGGVVADRRLLSGGDASQDKMAADLAPNDGQWVAIDAAAGVNPDATQRFDTATVVGFVSRQGDSMVAVSGTCTHLGCLLQPNPEAGRLDCPCHRTSFGYDGRVLFSQLDVPPAPLPRIGVRQRDGTVEVLIPRQT